ncbi:hypothetical protein BGZ99_007139 [Dissophora globulifera]|uniref:Uncharacterized protein n=1 Tax=Dissophora globulifera TaxID=979702 RepID=A0A9P6UQ67_9FUNG|nr:hypothetical protein BGZ99_007139 [Dissophora globulifera]
MGGHWKREKVLVQDHKFDFINVDDFVDNSFWRQFRYMLVFAAIMRGILVYCSDIFTAANLLANSNSNSFVPKSGVQLEVFGKLPFDVYKYLFSGCIILGFILLGLEVRRARAIIISKDISHAFTSLIASRYYTVRSYPHFCFFAQINNSKKMVDEVAFFCFFTFRNWKRLMLADAPRQVINATILYQTFRGHSIGIQKDSILDWDTVVGQGNSFLLKKISLGAMIFTVFMFALSLLSLIAAVLLYIPLVSHIQGNLKEYCCFKIDKRIDELIKKNTKNRANAALKEQAKSGKNNKDIAMNTLKQPTLPQLDLLEAPPLPAATPRNVYNQASTPTPYSGSQWKQQDYGYSQNAYNSPSTQQAGYTGNYGSDDYFQAKPPTKGSQQQREGGAFDPYAESAFTADDIYDSYVGNQEQQYLQQRHDRDMYGEYYDTTPSAPAPSSQTPVGATPSSRTKQYDDYSYQQRSASPLPSQHGSDMDSNQNGSSGRTYVGGNNSQQGYNSGGNGGYGGQQQHQQQGYGNEYYPATNTYSPQLAPQHPRRQDAAPGGGRSYRNGGNGGNGGY